MEERPDPESLAAAAARSRIEGLYVHIPFCFHKCHYCDFYSITRQTPERMGRFVDRVLAEAAFYADARRAPAGLRTVFFGGGTPSLLPPEPMRQLIAGLRNRLDLGGVEEFTVECNPETVDPAYLSMLRTAGVDRLSFGAQSFDRSQLSLLERHHDPDQIPRVVEWARAAGFQRVNLDLIFAIPGQTMESWVASLTAALGLGTEHVSAYGLTYEPNTPLAVRQRLGQFERAADELELDMLRTSRHLIRDAGMRAYEISNYARPGEECRHNLVYWRGGNYLGLGPSAASHADGLRWKNRPHLREWENAIDQKSPVVVEFERLTPTQRLGEFAMLMLRLDEGIDSRRIESVLGFDPRPVLAPILERLAGDGWLQIAPDTARLTDRGIAVADAIAGEIVRQLDDPAGTPPPSLAR